MNNLGDLRSLLFVPGNRFDRVNKAAGLDTDAVIIDLEDAVAIEHKDFARSEVPKAIAEIDFGERLVGVRVNRITTSSGMKDLLSLPEWTKLPDMLLLPEVESNTEVRIYEQFLSDAGLGDMKLLPIVESARGLRRSYEIASATPLVAGLLFGAGDLSADIGCRMDWEPLLCYRATFVAGASEASVPAFDVPYLNLQDPEGLRNESRRVKAMGFSGKTCIHPTQLADINQAFMPTDKEVKQAEQIIEAIKSKGTGAIVVAGRMVDAPIIRSAEAVLRIAKRSGYS